MSDYWDDATTGTGTLAEAKVWLEKMQPIYEDFVARHPVTKGGAYRDREGLLVTWDSTEDGSYQVIQTWPGE